MNAGDVKPPEQRVEAVERALTILNAFADGTPRMGLSALAARAGFYPSTVLRLSASLERFGYLHRDSDGDFRLGPALWRLGVLYQASFNLADYVRPTLKALVEATGETASFYVREKGKRICLYRQNGPRMVRSHLDEGAELPLDRGAAGHILVAYSGKDTGKDSGRHAKVRSRGYAISKGERDPELDRGGRADLPRRRHPRRRPRHRRPQGAHDRRRLPEGTHSPASGGESLVPEARSLGRVMG